MMARYFARVDETDHARPVRQLAGLPPELAGGRDDRVPLPRPCVLIVQQGSGRGLLMYRYTRDRRCGGDTWHENLEHAQEQAEFEFGDAVGEWRQVPDDVEDPVGFALEQAG